MTAKLLVHRWMDQTLTVHAVSGYKSVGDPTYSTASASHACRVEKVQRLVKGPDGRDVLATTRVFVGTTTAAVAPTVTVQSKVTLPDGTVPKLLAVDTQRKRAGGTDHQVLYFG